MIATDADVVRAFGDVDARPGEMDDVVADLHVATAKDHLRSIHHIDDVIVCNEAAVAFGELDRLVPAGLDVVVIHLPVFEL